MDRFIMTEKERCLSGHSYGRLAVPKWIFFTFAMTIALFSLATLLYSMPAEFIGLVAFIALTGCHFIDTVYHQKSDRRLMAIFQANPSPIIVYGKQGRLLNINPAFTRVFGWTRRELNTQASRFVPVSQIPISAQKMEEIFRTGLPVSFESQRMTKSGDVLDVILSTAIVRGRDQTPIEAFVIIMDITERKQIEARLRQAHKMEAMGTLASGIAHDFNNILSPLIGCSEMLMDDLSPDSPMQEMVADILTAGERAKELVQQILAFSRQSSNAPKSLKIQPMVTEALRLLRSSIPATIEIRQEIDPDCGPVVADPTQVHQVVMNLATNACQAMEKTGGKLSVKLNQVCMEADQTRYTGLNPGQYAHLMMADTGVGIAKQNMAKIFDPYFTTKDQGRGTGLGLSLVQGILKSVGGGVQVFSESGAGCEFHVYWPLDELENKTARTDPSAPISGGTEKILLVDDEATVTKMVRQVLGRLGYQVTAHTSSLEALENFKVDPGGFDLVLTDMTMPEMAGDQLARAILAIRPNIPVIVSTGYSQTLNSEMAMAIGIRAVLIKPAGKSNLAAAVRKALDDAKAFT